MPIVERDPWRMQYFEGVECPDDLNIPTEDGDAWQWYPQYHWVYDKLRVAESQGLPVAPHGIEPPHYPVFSKPVFNMKGMGVDSRIIASAEEYEIVQTPGHIWMDLLEGEHVSSDVAVVDGEPHWWRHVTGLGVGDGVFDYWTVHAEARPEIERYCGDWLRRHLKGYTGMANFETIGGKIIEAHLRFADQWPDLYGRGWVDALVRLYRDGVWDYDDDDRHTGYSVVLFGAHGPEYRHPPADVVARHRERDDVSSLQITFHENKPAAAHAMPPGGFRLAIVNCRDLAVGMEIRERLALRFWSTRDLRQRPDGTAA